MTTCLHPLGHCTIRFSCSARGGFYGATCRCGAYVPLDRETWKAEFDRRVAAARER